MYEKNSVFTCTVLAYNSNQYLFTAIDSILEQTYQYIELIVADDGTVNFPLEDVREYIEKKKMKNIVRYEVFSNEKNLGTVCNLNNALAKASGEYCFAIAADDALYSNTTIEKVVGAFDMTESMAISFSRLRCRETDLSGIAIMPNAKARYWASKLNTPLKQYKSFSKGMFYDGFSGSCVVYRLSFLKEMNFYNPVYRLVEDAPFFVRITRCGYKIDERYDIILTKYREGGISSIPNKKLTKTKIQQRQDLVTLYDVEIEPYMNMFTKSENAYMRYIRDDRYKSTKQDVDLPVKANENSIVIFLYRTYYKIIRLLLGIS